MSDQQGKQDVSYLHQLNAELTRGLSRCHLLVEDCRAHLVPANSNEPPFMVPGDEGAEEDEQRG